ncbi:MAG TPA: hypothetical protein VGN88_11110 [Phycisphaerae bacterium]
MRLKILALGALVIGSLPFVGQGDLIEVDQPMPVQMQPQMLMIDDGPMMPNMGGFDGRWGRRYGNYYQEEQLRNLIQQALQQPRNPGTDSWDWRETVENNLVNYGTMGLAILRQEASRRDGYEGDAVQVAIFRLENAPLDPKNVLEEWGRRRFSPAVTETKPLKITRVLDVKDAVGLRDIFPHHLFYGVEYAKQNQHVVVAMAADAKVQPLEGDAGLQAFFRGEAMPQLNQIGKEHVAAAAALLAAARSAAVYKPDQLRVVREEQTYKASLTSGGTHQNAMLTFDDAGRTLTLLTDGQTVAPKVTAPIAVPAGVTPPPAMPD